MFLYILTEEEPTKIIRTVIITAENIGIRISILHGYEIAAVNIGLSNKYAFLPVFFALSRARRLFQIFRRATLDWVHIVVYLARCIAYRKILTSRKLRWLIMASYCAINSFFFFLIFYILLRQVP